MNIVDPLKPCEITYHECTSKDEVESCKEDIVFEEEELIKKNHMENREIMKEKKHENEQKLFHSMEGNYEKTIEVNNEHKLNVDEQEDDIKHLKEQYDEDDEDEVQEIRAARTPMKKNRPVQCV